jgi:TonB family protein
MLPLAIKSCGVFGLAFLLTMILRKRSAAERHLVWTASAAAALILPLLSLLIPVLRIPVATPEFAMPVFRANAVSGADGEASPAVFAQNRSSSHRTIPNWPGLVWSVGSLILLIRMLAGYAAMWRVRRRAGPVVGARCPVEVLETASTGMPMTFGIVRPVILLPAEARGWSEEKMRVVLAHELAHVRRGDAAWHVLAWIGASVYWWNPLAWAAWRGVRKESECAADDLVLKEVAATDYASQLLEIAKGVGAPWAAVAMARRSQFEGRMRAILDARVNRTAPGGLVKAAAALCAVAVLVPLAALRAQDAPAVPADIDGAIRTAMAQKNSQVLENAAQAAEQERKYDTAQRLLQSAVEIRGEVSGRASFDYGAGLLKLGDLEIRRHDWPSADDFYSRAAAVLGDRLEAARALTGLGISAIVNKHLAQAAEYLQKAQSIDPKSGVALMWMAVVHERQGESQEADALFRQAMGAADPKSVDLLVVAKTYASFLRTQGRPGEAGELDTRVAAAWKAMSASSSAPPSGTVYKIGGSVSAPSVMSKVEPQYSAEASAAKLEGTVRLSTEIGPDGIARNSKVITPLGLGLDDNAIDAISQWRFRPGMKDGQFVTVAATIEVSFHLL